MWEIFHEKSQPEQKTKRTLIQRLRSTLKHTDKMNKISRSYASELSRWEKANLLAIQAAKEK